MFGVFFIHYAHDGETFKYKKKDYMSEGFKELRNTVVEEEEEKIVLHCVVLIQKEELSYSNQCIIFAHAGNVSL